MVSRFFRWTCEVIKRSNPNRLFPYRDFQGDIQFFSESNSLTNIQTTVQHMNHLAARFCTRSELRSLRTSCSQVRSQWQNLRHRLSDRSRREDPVAYVLPPQHQDDSHDSMRCVLLQFDQCFLDPLELQPVECSVRKLIQKTIHRRLEVVVLQSGSQLTATPTVR